MPTASFLGQGRHRRVLSLVHDLSTKICVQRSKEIDALLAEDGHSLEERDCLGGEGRRWAEA